MNASGFLQTVALVMCAVVSCFAEPIWQNRCDKSREWDVLWDGVGKDGNLRVHGGGQSILIQGMNERNVRIPPSAAWADVTGDGMPELVVGDGWGFLWMYQPTTGTNVFPPQFTTGVYTRTFMGSCMVIDVADFNDDGLNDVLVGGPDGVVTVVQNLGGGRFAKSDGLPTVVGFNGYRLVSERPDQTFPVAMASKTPVCIGCFSAPRYVDWNRDGKKDLVIGEGSYSANGIYLYLNRLGNKTPDFGDGRRDYLAYGMGREHLAPAIADLDGDGDLDILAGERTGELTWFENVPRPKDAAADTPYLLEPKAVTVKVGGQDKPAGDFSRPTLVDMDGDGDLDLLLGGPDGSIMASRNTGTAKAPVFDTAVTLKGTDVLKPRREPEGWGLWHGGYGNSGIAFESLEEQGEDKGTTVKYFKVFFFNGYIGQGGHIEIGGPAQYDQRYNVSFRARGQGFRALECSYRQAGEDTVNDKKDTIVGVGGVTEAFEFNTSDKWNSFSKSVRFERLTEESKKEKRAQTGFTFYISMADSKPDAWFDITDFVVEPSGGIEKQDEPSTNTVKTAKP